VSERVVLIVNRRKYKCKRTIGKKYDSRLNTERLVSCSYAMTAEERKGGKAELRK
jgi:hypothetical protein